MAEGRGVWLVDVPVFMGIAIAGRRLDSVDQPLSEGTTTHQLDCGRGQIWIRGRSGRGRALGESVALKVVVASQLTAGLIMQQLEDAWPVLAIAVLQSSAREDRERANDVAVRRADGAWTSSCGARIGNQSLDVRRQRWAAGRPRLPPPRETESFAMPADQCVRLHDRQHGPPVDQTREHHERDPHRIISAAGLDLAFSVESQLLAEKGILRDQLRPRSEAKRHEPDDVKQQAEGGPPHH